MAKVIDITDKLSFEDNPALVIKGKKFEVNADAPTVLKIMGLMKGDNAESIENVLASYELLFSEKTRAEIDKLKKLSFDGLTTIIQEAMNLIIGGDDSAGEQ